MFPQMGTNSYLIADSESTVRALNGIPSFLHIYFDNYYNCACMFSQFLLDIYQESALQMLHDCNVTFLGHIMHLAI